ncbi:uncharacterized protein OCT59_017124 [Rhizophagus irregularis]|uniref:uncharacterized protein n=1 Tax=Rhizophagus irregularis TaxID=588596 RepID=UPI003323C484|nr:hypothetical protein OCT59_017124 [Rhizophagus irregularis]
MENNNFDLDSDLSVSELNVEAFAKIKNLQQQHDSEIELLANELNVHSYFIKSVMKDYREPAIRKQRKISGFNIWQSNWWATHGKGLNIKDKGSQKLCADAWNALNNDTRKYYEEEAKNAANLRVKEQNSFITNAKSRKTQLNNGIQDIRKMFRTLHVTCGMEFITLAVSNYDELRSHWFGSNIGEEFYQTYSNLSDAIIPFRCFSILKKKGYNVHILLYITFDFLTTTYESETGHTFNLSAINISKPNSIETRNKVRFILRQKFEQDVKGNNIPYKRWKTQTSYKVIGWPLDVEFQDYSNLKEEERIKVLDSLYNIRFEQNE